jgi:hypothetical protein
MEMLVVVERLADKFGMSLVGTGIVSWGVWQLLKPIIANINKSTETLSTLCIMLSAHNQNAIDMHMTCREHGEYLCDTKDLLNTNREKIMIKLGEIHSDVKSINKTDNKNINREGQ